MEDALKILVVDDSAIARMAIHYALQRAQMPIQLKVEVETRAAALEQLNREDFDCVLVAHELPDSTGLDFVQQVRDRRFPVAVIVLTGQGDERLAVELMKAGANDYLLKSCLTPEDLSRSIGQAIRLSRAEFVAQEAMGRLRESEERYRLVLEGSNDGIWDWNLRENTVVFNDRLYQILGLDRSEIAASRRDLIDYVHPQDRSRLLATARSHLERGDSFDLEFRLQHTSGHYRYCSSRGKAQRDEQGVFCRILGTISDITHRKQTEAKIVQLNRDLERRVMELQTLLDLIPVGIGIAEDPDCQTIKVNENLGMQLGIAPQDQVLRESLNSQLAPYRIYQHGQELSIAELPMQKSATLGVGISGMELDVVQATGKVVKVLAEVAPLFDEHGQARGSIGAFLDITDRKRIEDSQRFLANASALLSTFLDAQTILESLASLAVPYLSDWCFIHAFHDGYLQIAALHHGNADQIAHFQILRQRYPAPQTRFDELSEFLKIGQAKLYPNLQNCLDEPFAEALTHPQILEPLGLRSVMVVPLLARERVLGLITLVSAESERQFTPKDLELAEDLARRAALAVDNARLYQATQRAEQNLRQAILVLGEQQQRLKTLQRLTDLLNQRLTDLPELLQGLVDCAYNAISGAEFGLIMLQSSAATGLELTATAGFDSEQFPEFSQQQQGTFSLEAILEQVFQTGESYLMQEEVKAMRPASPASLCAVVIESPYASRRGVLAIGNHQDETAFNEDDLHLLMAFSEQAAIALSNAQLINALEEREEQLARQNALLVRQNQELEDQRQQIQLQNLQLTEAAQLKSQFLATMSHELRTPMTAIMGFSQLLLRQKDLAMGQTEMIGRILNNGKNLLALINDILDLSKIEAGRLELKLERFDLDHLLQATADEIRSLAEQKHLTLQSQSQLVNTWVINDSSRMRQVFVNLLSNAIKFTDVGQVKVQLQELSPDRLRIVVEDTGIGIAPEDIAHIFEEFRQLDQSITRRHPGTGLGLAITRWLVQMMNGSITVNSEVGHGSTFTIEIPREVREVQP